MAKGMSWLCAACQCLDQAELTVGDPLELGRRPSILKNSSSSSLGSDRSSINYDELKLNALAVATNGPAIAAVVPLLNDGPIPCEVVFQDSSEAKNEKNVIFEERPIGFTIKPNIMPLRVSTVSSRVAESGVSEGFIVKKIAGIDVTSPAMTAEQVLMILEKATAGLPESGPMVDMVFEDKSGSLVKRRLLKDAFGMKCAVQSAFVYEGGGRYKEKYSIKVHSVEHFAITRGIRPKWIVKSIDGRELDSINEVEANEIVQEINNQDPWASTSSADVKFYSRTSFIDDSPDNDVHGKDELTASVTFGEVGY